MFAIYTVHVMNILIIIYAKPNHNTTLSQTSCILPSFNFCRKIKGFLLAIGMQTYGHLDSFSAFSAKVCFALFS